MINDAEASIPNRVQELEELLKLAETSTNSLDKLDHQHDHFQMVTIFTGLIFYFLAVGSFWLFLQLQHNEAKFSSPIFPFIVTAGLIAFVASLPILYSRLARARLLNRELRAEREIHKRLISLIDQQMHRVSSNEIISPVTRATFEIRIKRMERVKKSA